MTDAKLDTAQIAEYLNCSTKTVHRYARRAEDPLPHEWLGSELRFDVGAINEWLSRQPANPRRKRSL